MSVIANAVSSLFGGAQQPAAAAAPTPVAAPAVPASQVAQMPDQGTAAKVSGSPGGGTGGSPGVASTFLSGGVDPSKLDLTKNTLLGGTSTLG